MHKKRGTGATAGGSPGGQELREGSLLILICFRGVDRSIQKEQLCVLSRAFQLLLGFRSF